MSSKVSSCPARDVLITRVLMSVRLSLCLWCLQDRWAQQVSVAKRFQCNQPNATPVGWPPLQDSAPLCWGGLMLAAQRSPCAGPRGYEGAQGPKGNTGGIGNQGVSLPANSCIMGR